MGRTRIEWAEEVWNPVTGCTPVSEGCKICYARRMAYRLRGRYGYPRNDPFRVTLHPERLDQPYHWKKPRLVFVCSMGDLFHNYVPSLFIEDVFDTIAECPQHTFLILTKRPHSAYGWASHRLGKWPDNAWLGTTVESQDWIARMDWIKLVKAPVHFLSLEPLLGPIDLGDLGDIEWVIVGAESGPGARPMKEDWVRDIRDQCIEAGVAFFYKQKLVDGKKVSMPELDGEVWDQFPWRPGGAATGPDTAKGRLEGWNALKPGLTVSPGQTGDDEGRG